MALALLIIRIILAIPTIIQLIHEIMKIIDELPKGEKAAAQAQLRGILTRHQGGHDPQGAHAELHAMKENLKGKYGVA